MSKLTKEEKECIFNLLKQDILSSRQIAKEILGSESRKSTVNDLRSQLSNRTPSSDNTEVNAHKGYSPDHGLVVPYPDGYKMGKVTIQRDRRGNIERTWERMCEDSERQQELIKQALKEMQIDIPRQPALISPKETLSNLCNLYPITDLHVGMLAWQEETGDDWDIKKASDMLIRWFETAIAQAPNAETGILCNLGDFMHFDGLEPVTPAHKNILDADTRFTKLVRVSIRLIRTVIDMLLLKHNHVHVIMSHGNHDEASSVWLREMFYEMYRDEPRISVDRNPDPYYCFTWGNTTLFFHHGDKAKMNRLDSVLVAKFKKEYGQSKYVYAHCGHLHHLKMNETNLMIVEQHRTLAARDAYASRGGYMAGRDAKVITYSKEFGEVSRLVISPEMLL